MEPSWLQYARREIGTTEVPGPGSNPIIETYAKEAGVFDVVSDDEVAWCAAFVGSMLSRGGQSGTGRAAARSYEKWGKLLLGPVIGAVTILSRPPSTWQGHVGFLIAANDDKIRLLGGNQHDTVSIADFPRNRVVAYRWPIGVLITPEWVSPRIGDEPADQNPTDR